MSVSFFRLLRSLMFIALVFLLMGTRACQEDYELGVQTAAPSPSPSPDDDDDDDDPIPSPSPSPTPSPSPSLSSSPSPSPNASPSPSPATAASMFRTLEATTQANAATQLNPENWLGEAFSDEVKSVDDLITTFENNLRSLLAEQPDVLFRASLITERPALLSDQDLQSFPSLAELSRQELGVNPFIIDTDGDGISDFEELIFGLDGMNPSPHQEELFARIAELRELGIQAFQ